MCRGPKQAWVASLPPEAGRDANREAIDDVVGACQIPSRGDLVTGDIAIPQGILASAHMLSLPHCQIDETTDTPLTDT